MIDSMDAVRALLLLVVGESAVILVLAAWGAIGEWVRDHTQPMQVEAQRCSCSVAGEDLCHDCAQRVGGA